MKLVPVKHTTVKMLLGARPTLPDGWEPIGKYAVRTDDWAMGVLIRNKTTGIYRLFSAGAIMSVDQIAAKEYKEPEGLFLWLFFYSSFSRSSALA